MLSTVLNPKQALATRIMKDLRIDTEQLYEYTMLSSPKRSLPSMPMVAIIATIFFGCGVILGWVSSGIRHDPVDLTRARAPYFQYGLDRSDTLIESEAMPKLAWLVSAPFVHKHTSFMMLECTQHSFLA
jgi:hypothetical protein